MPARLPAPQHGENMSLRAARRRRGAEGMFAFAA